MELRLRRWAPETRRTDRRRITRWMEALPGEQVRSNPICRRWRPGCGGNGTAGAFSFCQHARERFGATRKKRIIRNYA